MKVLKKQFVQLGCYAEEPVSADVILFNSHHNLKNVIRLKRECPEKIFVHRVDGPMAYRGKSGEKLDRQIFRINALVADGTVFQSEWSRQESYRKGMKINSFEVVIHNASDSGIFFPPQQKEPAGDKIKLIGTSWSNNPGKGFDIYHYLDENLDFEKYEMTFVGRIDKSFNNIKTLDPLPSFELAEKLRQHDIFIFASKIEACSNSLIEALTCGLPAVVRNSSSNLEVMGERGLSYSGKGDILMTIELLEKNLKVYKKQLHSNYPEKVGHQYLQFFQQIFSSDVKRKKLSLLFSLNNFF